MPWQIVPQLKHFKNVIFNRLSHYPIHFQCCHAECLLDTILQERRNRLQRLSPGDNHKNLSPVTWKADERAR